MSSTIKCSFILLLLLLVHRHSSFALSSDGTLLLSFKYSVLDDPLSVLADWNYDDDTPCSWNGVVCAAFPDPFLNSSAIFAVSRVVGLVLPNSQLMGSLPSDLGLIDHLRHLDLSDNFLNGTLPSSLFNSSELTTLSLANNEISGDLPDLVAGRVPNLQSLNLSDNALAGGVPKNLTLLPKLTVVSLKNNYISGSLPGGGFGRLRFLDLSSNLVNGTIPADFGVGGVRHLNLSRNKLSGEIPAEIGSRIPPDATVDLSFNNLTGGIPQSAALLAQKPAAFAGNPDLCGKPLMNLCTIPSTMSNPPNVSGSGPPEPPPAFAAMPKTPDVGYSEGNSGSSNGAGFKPATIAAIVVGDLGGIALLFVVLLYVYHVKKKQQQQQSKQHNAAVQAPEPSKSPIGFACCSRKKDSDGEEETSETGSSTEPEAKNGNDATLVTVDGDVELEMETLLKASAYILGSTGRTIVYKAVLADGTALAVRRVGESGAVDRLKDFEAQVRCIARIRHPNLLRIWGFYWGPDEKLLIHDYAPNGSLAVAYRHLGWEARLRIARGVARGLAYIHEKKSVHGNLRPSNILLASDMEARIGDFGLDRLLFGDAGGRPGGSARLSGSKRSAQSPPELSVAGPSSVRYQASESLKSIKPNAKWDVYSFGLVMLELMSGRLFSEEELCRWDAGLVAEERNRVVRMADPAMRGEVEGKEEDLLSCFRLGFACAAMAPQRRPSMKDVVMVLDRLPCAAASSSSSSL